MTLDALMQQDGVQDLRESVRDGFHFLLWSIGKPRILMATLILTLPLAESMRDIRETRTISEERLRKMEALEKLLHEVQDTTELFPSSIGKWIISMMPETFGDHVITPARSLKLAWSTLDRCQSAIEELLLRARTHHLMSKPEDLLACTFETATPEEPRAAGGTLQEDVSNTLQEHANSISEEDEPAQLDVKLLTEYDQLLVQQDRAGGCILTEERSESASKLAEDYPMLYFQYREDDPNNVELFGNDGAILLAESPFRRVLKRDDESMITKEALLVMDFPVKDEVEKCAIALWGMPSQQNSN